MMPDMTQTPIFADNPETGGLTPLPLPECALARAIKAVGDAWSLLILREALYGVQTFTAMQQDLGVPKAVLSGRLKRLREQGILETISYRPTGRRAYNAYRLTDKGRALLPALIALRQWSDAYSDAPPSRLRIKDGKDGAPVRVGLLRPDGQEINDLDSLMLEIQDNA
jgi:DNA-binding HxlR family transcriptional regulator